MMRRRTATASLFSLGLLASCTTRKKAPIVGTQIPVLPEGDDMDVAVNPPPVSIPQASALAAWPQPLANPTHAPGNVSAPLNFKPQWRAAIGTPGGTRQPLAASPVIAEGKVFTMDADATVRAFSLADGKYLWHANTRPKHASEQNLGGGIAYDSGIVYASTGYAELRALDPATGKLLWHQQLDFPTRSAPLVAGGLVSLITQDDLLLTFDATSGTPGWRFDGSAGQPNSAAVAVAGAPAFADGIIVAGFSNGLLAAINANSGTPVWEQSLAASFGQSGQLDLSDIVASPVIAGGVVYAINLGDTMMAVDLHSGAKVWTHGATGTQPICLAGGFAFVLDKNQILYAVHADDGLISWSLQLPLYAKPKKQKDPISWAGPLLVNGQLLLVSDHGTAALVDPVAGALQHVVKLRDGGAADMAPLAAGGVLLQLTRDAKLTAYA
ncbi:MAG: PQQ-binding-like beta-propeller repeat protein [Acidocella sp.]|nr:PQQ-binding-like beta-propeller repeat protein [Acidocella sp.]